MTRGARSQRQKEFYSFFVHKAVKSFRPSQTHSRNIKKNFLSSLLCFNNKNQCSYFLFKTFTGSPQNNSKLLDLADIWHQSTLPNISPLDLIQRDLPSPT